MTERRDAPAPDDSSSHKPQTKARPSIDSHTRRRTRIQGILIFAVALMVLVTMNACAKSLVQHLPFEQAAWWRYAIQMPMVLFMIPYLRRTGFSLLKDWRLQIMRGLSLLGIVWFVYQGLSSFPLAETAMIIGTTPFLVALLAWTVLKEKIPVRNWVVIILGFLGTALVMRPGSGLFNPASLFVVVAATCFAIQQINSRQLAPVANPWHTVAYSILVGFVPLSLLLPFSWTTPAPEIWPLLLLNGVLSGIADVLLVLAFMRVAASDLAPIQYLQVFYALVLGYLWFGDVPDLIAIAGAGIIIVSGLILLRGGPAGD